MNRSEEASSPASSSLNIRIMWLLAALAPFAMGIWAGLWKTNHLNHDFENYHFYVADAFWRHRLGHDLFAAGIMSYANPLVDLPYYIMLHILGWTHLAAGIMGFWQGLNIPVITAIAFFLLPPEQRKEYPYLPLILALIGALTPLQINEINSAFSDSTTGLFILISLFLVIVSWPVSRWTSKQYILLLLTAGCVGGLGAGLKISNIPYVAAIALGIMICHPGKLISRFYATSIYSLGIVPTFLCTEGWWLFRTWQDYADPLFPFYTKYFPNSLVHSMGNMNTGFGPQTLIKTIFWPFLVAFHSGHIKWGNEINLHSYMWGGMAILAVIGGLLTLKRKFQLPFLNAQLIQQIYWRNNVITSSQILLLFWLSISFLFWELQFSIYRYLAPVEALVPLGLFLLIIAFFPRSHAVLAATLIVSGIFCCMTARDHGKSWGDIVWTKPYFHVQTPHLSDPENTKIIIFRPSCIYSFTTASWIIPFFPRNVSFFEIQPDADYLPDIICNPDGLHQAPWNAIPLTESYYDRIRDLLADTQNHSYALLGVPGGVDYRTKEYFAKERTRQHQEARSTFKRHGLAADWEKCISYDAYEGTKPGFYELCPLRLAHSSDEATAPSHKD